MKILNRITITNGTSTQIHCDMDDGSRWIYSKGAEVEWYESEPSTDSLEKSLTQFLNE